MHRLTTPVSSICLMYDNSVLVAGSFQGSIQLFDCIDQFCEIDNISGHKAEITNIHFMKVNSASLLLFTLQDQDILVTTGRDSMIYLWTTKQLLSSTHRTLTLFSTLQGHQGDVTAITSIHNGKYILSGGRDHSIRLWNVQTGKCLRHIEDTSSFLYFFSLSID